MIIISHNNENLFKQREKHGIYTHNGQVVITGVITFLADAEIGLRWVQKY